MTNERKQQLLVLLLVLVAIKFVGQPLVEWQNAKVSELQRSKERLVKMEQLIVSSSKVNDIFNVAEANNNQLKQQFPSAESVSNFRLQAQQEVSTLAARYNLEVEMFDWAGEAPISINGFRGLGISFEVSGAVLDIAKFHAAINSDLGFLLVEDSELVFRGSLIKSKVGRFSIQGVAVVKNDQEQAS